jgi:hypothetical protein
MAAMCFIFAVLWFIIAGAKRSAMRNGHNIGR